MWAALGIVAALRERDRTGRAVEVTTALFETALTWISYQAAGYFGDGVVPQPQGSGTAMVVPSQVFPTADGQAMITAGSDALFRRLADALGEPGLATDPRFADNPGRVRNRQALVAAISAHTRRLVTADLLERLRDVGVPAAPILTVDRVLQEPQTASSGMILSSPHARVPDYRAVGLPIRWDRQRPPLRRVPPFVGEHSMEVLSWLGYTLEEVRGLQARGVVE
jgi:formyl-CoA transferase/CoA:oxalate CoA-transferase